MCFLEKNGFKSILPTKTNALKDIIWLGILQLVKALMQKNT